VNNEVPGSSETLIAIYQTTRYHVPQDCNFGKGLVGPSASLFNPLNAELNPICHMLSLLGAHHIFHISELRVNLQKYLTDFDEMFFPVYAINCIKLFG